MIDVKHNHCKKQDCNILANYNYVGFRIGKYCNKHKKDGMEIVTTVKCAEPGCRTTPCYNFNNFRNGKYCAKHKEAGMVDVVNPKCQQNGCTRQPRFNWEGELRGLYCKLHKKDKMINIYASRCAFVGCGKIPSFNYDGERIPIFCADHRHENMTGVSTPKCISSGCVTRASFNFETEKQVLYCSVHKLDGMIDIKATRCKSEWCSTQVGNKYDGYCFYCFSHLFPLDERLLNRYMKTKELTVRTWLVEFWGDMFIHDKSLWAGDCSCPHKRRIDFRCYINNFLIAVEVDEKQHMGKQYADEETRYNDIAMLHGGPMIFVRYNPDKYQNEIGKWVSPSLDHRKKVLVKKIQQVIDFAKKKDSVTWLLKVIHLFYNKV